MRSFAARSVALACALALAACTSMQVVSDRGATAAADTPVTTTSLHVDDQVRITTRDGSVRLLRLTAVSDTELAGVPPGATAVTTIPADQVARIERREISAGKTTLAVIGGIGTAALIAYALAVIALIVLLAH